MRLLRRKTNLTGIAALGIALPALVAAGSVDAGGRSRSAVPVIVPSVNPVRSASRVPPRSQATLARPQANLAPTWTFIGPMPIKGEFAIDPSIPPALTAVTGRVSTLAVDPQARGRLFVGEASGGLWRSTDGGVSFIPVFDSEPTVAMGWIALDPVNTRPTTIYLATGEGNLSDSLYGQGIFRSTDLGQSWTELAPGTFALSGFTKLEADTSHNPPYLYAGVTFAGVLSRTANGEYLSNTAKDGLWRSTDGGNSWAQYPAKTFGHCLLAGGPCPAQDVVVDAAASNHVYASIQNSGVYLSTDSGTTWSKANIGGHDHGRRTSLAVAPSASGTVYAMAGDADGSAYNGFFRSTDFGVTWSSGTVPTVTIEDTVYDGTGGSSATFSQSDYDQALVVSPTDSDHVFFGGVLPYASTDGGKSWVVLRAGNGTHTDQHAAVFDPFNADQLYWGNDGGVYSDQIASDTFTALNATLSGTQPYAIGPHPWDNNFLIAGLQDNDVQLYSGDQPWTDVTQPGDGGVSLYDQVNPALAYSTFTEGAIQVSTDSGLTWDSTEPTNALANALSAAGQETLPFLSPLAVDPSISGRVFFGAQSVFVSTDHLISWAQQTTQDLTNGGAGIYDVEFAPSDHTRAFSVAAAKRGFAIYATRQADLDSGASWTDVSAMLLAATGRPLNNTAIPTSVTLSNDPDVVYVTFGGFSAHTGIGHIYRSTDFGESWARDDGSSGPAPLPDEPTLKLLADRTDPVGDTLLAGTSAAVYRSTDSGATWSEFDTLTGGGLVPKVPIFDLQQNFNGVIYAGTHGRGVYILTAPAPAGAVSASAINLTTTLGQTNVDAGKFTLVNSSGFPEAIGSVIVDQSVNVFFGLSLSAKVGSFPPVPASTMELSPKAVFVFNPPLMVPVGATAVFSLTGTFGAAKGNSKAVLAGAAGPVSSYLAALLFSSVLFCVVLLPVHGRSRRVTIGALILVVVAASYLGCGHGGNSIRIVQSTHTLIAVNGAIGGGAAAFVGVPATLSHVTLVF